MRTAPRGTRGQGALPKALQEEAKDWERLTDKQRSHMQQLKFLRDKVAEHASEPPVGSPRFPEEDGVTVMNRSYTTKQHGLGRSYARGIAFQSMSRRMRAFLGDDNLVDWDIRNAMFPLPCRSWREWDPDGQPLKPRFQHGASMSLMWKMCETC